LNLSLSNHTRLSVVTSWQDHCEIFCNSKFVEQADECIGDGHPQEILQFHEILQAEKEFLYGDFLFHAHSDTLFVQPKVQSPSNSSEDVLHLTLRVPEYFNIDIQADDLNMVFRNKFQGDVSIKCNSGTIELDKVRGNAIYFDIGTSKFMVKKLLEGNCSVIAGEVSAKMINGDDVKIVTSQGDVRVEAMYAKKALIQCKGDGNIHIGLLQGYLKSQIFGSGDISVKNIDGCVQIEAMQGDVDLQINKLMTIQHSLKDSNIKSTIIRPSINQLTSFMNNYSFVKALKGRIQVTMDPSIQATVMCESISGAIDTGDGVTILSDEVIAEEEAHLLHHSAPFEHNMMKVGQTMTTNTVRRRRLFAQIDDQLKSSRSSKISSKHLSSSSSSGKINLKGAEEQSLRTFETNERQVGEKDDSNSSGGYMVDLILIAGKKVCLETISWMDAIKKKHGFL